MLRKSNVIVFTILSAVGIFALILYTSKDYETPTTPQPSDFLNVKFTISETFFSLLRSRPAMRSGDQPSFKRRRIFLKTFIKIFIGFLCGIILSLVLFFLWQKSNTASQTRTLNNALIQSCHSNETYDGTKYTYTNNMFKFKFSYPADLIGCEKPLEKMGGHDIATILFLKRAELNAQNLNPILVISINAEEPKDRAPQVVLSEEKITIGDITATTSKLRFADCLDPACPFTVSQFTKDGNSFSIWEREHIEGLFNRFAFF